MISFKFSNIYDLYVNLADIMYNSNSFVELE
jgi:hypothetical protein